MDLLDPWACISNILKHIHHPLWLWTKVTYELYIACNWVQFKCITTWFFSSLPSYIPWSFYSFEVPPIHYWLSSLFWQSKSARTNYFSCYKSHSISLPPSVARSGSLYLVTKTSFWWLREAERANWSCVFCTYVSLVVQVENGNSQKEKNPIS